MAGAATTVSSQDEANTSTASLFFLPFFCVFRRSRGEVATWASSRDEEDTSTAALFFLPLFFFPFFFFGDRVHIHGGRAFRLGLAAVHDVLHIIKCFKLVGREHRPIEHKLAGVVRVLDGVGDVL